MSLCTSQLRRKKIPTDLRTDSMRGTCSTLYCLCSAQPTAYKSPSCLLCLWKSYRPGSCTSFSEMSSWPCQACSLFLWAPGTLWLAGCSHSLISCRVPGLPTSLPHWVLHTLRAPKHLWSRDQTQSLWEWRWPRLQVSGANLAGAAEGSHCCQLSFSRPHND
jgi:hypothetical protein